MIFPTGSSTKSEHVGVQPWYRAHVVCSQMLRFGFGAALWLVSLLLRKVWYLISGSRNPTPTPRLAIGDVGFIKEGQFRLLFRATCSVDQFERNVPRGFEQLKIPASDIQSTVRSPYPLHTRSVSLVDAESGRTLDAA